MKQEIYLQQILGTDKRNPSFTICRDIEGKYLHVYYGGELLEKVPDDRNHPEYKLMVAQLHNAGVKDVSLKKAFRTDRKTMERWGDALKSGDPELLVRVLAGRGAHRKLTPEIRAFVRMRFRSVYEENPYSYNRQMRAEIEEIFGESVCPETIRPLLKKMKEQWKEGVQAKAEKRENGCECCLDAEGDSDEKNEVLVPETAGRERMSVSDIRQQSPVSDVSSKAVVRFDHHLGVLLFSDVLLRVEAMMKQQGWLVKQWLATILLGAVNIEQSKLLDFDSLDDMLGKTLCCHHPQRLQLSAMASTQAAEQLLAFNAGLVNAQGCSDFYYDPHAKHYTGQLKILKGWCGSKHFADKALYMDFIHTSDGHPVHVTHTDNYQDLRQRFCKTIRAFRSSLSIDKQGVLTFVLDRGIFGREIFQGIVADAHLHVITWEKNYKQGTWDEKKVNGAFVMEHCRNRVEDVKKYSFKYMDQDWEKDSAMRLLRVRTTNPKGRTIELGVLSDDRERPAEEVIRLMFLRWIQENDFKYLDKHFGINQITSYVSIPYRQLKEQVENKQMKSGEYKALEKERQVLRARLKTLLFQEHQKPGKNAQRPEQIKELTLQDKRLTEKMEQTQKQVSRLDYLIEENYRRLDTSSKMLFEVQKLIARNAFYQALTPFKKMYNNYRDDHAIFCNLSSSDGFMITRSDEVEIHLFPTAHYRPGLRIIVKELFDRINAAGPRIPDGSDRRICFRLGEKTGIRLASAKGHFRGN